MSTIYRFLYYRLGSHTLAEDLTSETFFKALRSLGSFRWQGKDFGAWRGPSPGTWWLTTSSPVVTAWR